MNKMMRVCTSYLLSMMCCSQLWANGCEISQITSNQLELLPEQHNSSNMAFSVKCPQPFNISFNSHQSRSDGISYLSSGKHKIRTKLSAQGDRHITWATPISQQENITHHYVVTATLIEPITAITPAGTYRDNIRILIEY
ncbi:hypothetical protein SAMN05421749_103469 [Acinetobacter marinus]|uniref:Spore coat protein U (SCPU) domain-containing protein n=1 Tax=Acinetobacter marinus TaxID=281375 RepID=A0A1G6JVU3_9GAMM|nr:hypothetical protein [Acinetobacter marinus]SDC22751.1 hypothetical protein SAMN05421749_103469 [Acinetobacter marinus]